MARHSAAELLTGAVILLLAAGFLGYAVAHSGRTGLSGYPLIARFDHIDGLTVGSDVRLAGVKVGTVSDARIDPQSYLAVVTLTVPTFTPARRTSDPTVRPSMWSNRAVSA